MVRLIVLILVGLLFFGGHYMVVFKRGDVNKTLGGYKKAATPQEAADMFKKAITDRDYAIAADYCTKDYAEQLKRGNDAARASEENAKNPSLARRTNGIVFAISRRHRHSVRRCGCWCWPSCGVR